MQQSYVIIFGGLILFLAGNFVLTSYIATPAFGDGLASETLPPSVIGNRNVTLSINSSPFLIDNFHTGTQVNFALLDVNDQQPKVTSLFLAISSKVTMEIFS